ncbi:MAG: hypothetical protein ABIJ17_02490 [Patescibacteria group bacterium]
MRLNHKGHGFVSGEELFFMGAKIIGFITLVGIIITKVIQFVVKKIKNK